MTLFAAYFTARSVPVFAGKLRQIQSRTNLITCTPSSWLRTWAGAKEVQRFGHRFSNSNILKSGAALLLAGVAMYPTGKRSLYPGVPIPVTSLHPTEKTKEGDIKLIVVENLKPTKEDTSIVKDNPSITERSLVEAAQTQGLQNASDQVFEEINSKIKEPSEQIETDNSKALPGSRHNKPTENNSRKVIPTEADPESETIVKILEKDNEKVVGASQSKTTEKKSEIPEHVPYLLVGAGTASFAAYRAIKSRDPTAKILIVGEENRLPYMRPPLSKELWYPPLEEVKTENGVGIKKLAPSNISMDDVELKFRQWNGKERSLYYEPEQFYTPLSKLQERENGGISVLRGRKVEKLDSEKQIAYLDDGTIISYDKCLLATGNSTQL